MVSGPDNPTGQNGKIKGRKMIRSALLAYRKPPKKGQHHQPPTGGFSFHGPVSEIPRVPDHIRRALNSPNSPQENQRPRNSRMAPAHMLPNIASPAIITCRLKIIEHSFTAATIPHYPGQL
jgi:hypothetical protein